MIKNDNIFDEVHLYLLHDSGASKNFIDALNNYKKFCLKHYANQPLEKRLDEYNLRKFLNYIQMSTVIMPWAMDRKEVNKTAESIYQYLNNKNIINKK